jgi:hypothetical protein
MLIDIQVDKYSNKSFQLSSLIKKYNMHLAFNQQVCVH